MSSTMTVYDKRNLSKCLRNILKTFSSKQRQITERVIADSSSNDNLQKLSSKLFNCLLLHSPNRTITFVDMQLTAFFSQSKAICSRSVWAMMSPTRGVSLSGGVCNSLQLQTWTLWVFYFIDLQTTTWLRKGGSLNRGTWACYFSVMDRIFWHDQKILG